MATAAPPKTAPVVRPIRNSHEFERVVMELDALADINPKQGTPEYDRMELLGILIAAYEEEHLARFENSSPQELVKFMAEQKGVGSAELADLFGGRSHLSEFYRGVRTLSKRQIVAIRDALGIPADLLLEA
jgi:HTH-type transcriptional regulator / antitoxin HigA